MGCGTKIKRKHILRATARREARSTVTRAPIRVSVRAECGREARAEAEGGRSHPPIYYVFKEVKYCALARGA